jgi:hypothetical protein
MSLSFEELTELEEGDRIIERDLGEDIEFELLEDPVVDHMVIDGETKRQVTFQARWVKGGDLVDHKATEGLMHYGGDYYRVDSQ